MGVFGKIKNIRGNKPIFEEIEDTSVLIRVFNLLENINPQFIPPPALASCHSCFELSLKSPRFVLFIFRLSPWSSSGMIPFIWRFLVLPLNRTLSSLRLICFDLKLFSLSSPFDFVSGFFAGFWWNWTTKQSQSSLRTERLFMEPLQVTFLLFSSSTRYLIRVLPKIYDASCTIDLCCFLVVNNGGSRILQILRCNLSFS